MKAETKKILSHIAQEVGRLPNQVAIEGHTDSRPYGKANYSNWELSADRANAARRHMDGAGLKPDQVTAVRGYADRVLRNRQDPLDFQNRRVSIIVLPKEKDQGLKAPLLPIPEGGSPPPPAGQPPSAVEAKGKPEPPPAAVGKGKPEPPGDAPAKPSDAREGKPEVPPVPSGKPAESGGAKPAPPAAPDSKPAEPGEQASPIKDASPEGQVQAEVKKLFEPFKPQERLGW